jgi:hypothetical protein
VLQVRQLQSRLRTLSMQIACGDKPACDALPGGLVQCCPGTCSATLLQGSALTGKHGHAGTDDTMTSVPHPSVDVDHLSEDELRRELKKVGGSLPTCGCHACMRMHCR